MKARIIGWHRRMAVIVAAVVLIWGASGILHPLMSWTNPRVASFMTPPSVPFTANEAVVDILKQHDIKQFQELRQIGTLLQVRRPGEFERLYIDLSTRKILDGGDRDRAVMLARHYAGLPETAIKDVVLVTAFSPEYTYVNRYLPVWKISFEDPRRLSVYVDTGTDRLGSITDRRKMILQALFQILHTGLWLEGFEPLRLTLMGLSMVAVFAMALSGLYMLVRSQGLRRGWRRGHRILAYAALLPLLVFPASGFFHLFIHSPLIYGAHEESVIAVDARALRYMPQGIVNDLRFVMPSWWRLQQGKEVIYLNAFDGHRIAGDEAFVRQSVPEGQGDISLVTSFTDEYGFAYKRLPVWRVDTGRELIFFEARTGIVAARIDPPKAMETWTFSRLHKWQFLDGLSERAMGDGPLRLALRDAVMVLFVFAGLGVAVLGLLIRYRRYKN